jgi:hypothetical protein
MIAKMHARRLFAAAMGAVVLSASLPYALTRATDVNVDLVDGVRGLLLGAGIVLCWMYFRARKNAP